MRECTTLFTIYSRSYRRVNQKKMSYRFVYPNGGAPVGGFGMDPTMMPTGYPNMYHDHRRSFSPESFSSSSESSDDYEYRGRFITREKRHPRDVVRAPTPPPIIKRVVERAPTPEPTIMERVSVKKDEEKKIHERMIIFRLLFDHKHRKSLNVLLNNHIHHLLVLFKK